MHRYQAKHTAPASLQLPPLPEVLTHEMALPIAYWTAGQCAVVLVLQFSRHGHDEPGPMAMKVTYSRGEDGRWEPPEAHPTHPQHPFSLLTSA